jgi:outer membrane protein TolC
MRLAFAFRIFSLFFLILILSSCTTNTPDVELPTQFRHSNNDLNDTKNLPYLAWWNQLEDKTLNELINIGLANNFDIQIANANLEQARGQLRQVELSWLPFVNIYGGFSQSPTFGSPGVFYGIFPQYFINLLQLPFKQKQANYNLALHQAKISAARLTLIGQITTSYITYIAELEQLKLLQTLEKDLNALTKIKLQAFQGGIASQQSAELLKSDTQMVVAQQQVVKHNLVVSQNAIRYLLNQNPGNIEAGTNFAKLNDNFIDPQSLPSTVLANRPDLLMAEMQLKIANEGINISATQLFPILVLDDFVDKQSNHGTWAKPNTFGRVQDAYINWQINPSVLGAIEASQGGYKAATFNYIKTVRQILREVDSDFAANSYYKQKLNAEKQAYINTSKEYSLQESLYKNSIIAYTELLNSKIRLDNLALSVNQTKLQYFLCQVVLFQDLAGGYNYNLKEDVNVK